MLMVFKLRHRDDLVSNYRTVSVPDMCRFPLLWRQLDHLDGKASNRPHMSGAEKNHHQFHKAHDFLESLRKGNYSGRYSATLGMNGWPVSAATVS